MFTVQLLNCDGVFAVASFIESVCTRFIACIMSLAKDFESSMYISGSSGVRFAISFS